MVSKSGRGQLSTACWSVRFSTWICELEENSRSNTNEKLGRPWLQMSLGRLWVNIFLKLGTYTYLYDFAGPDSKTTSRLHISRIVCKIHFVPHLVLQRG